MSVIITTDATQAPIEAENAVKYLRALQDDQTRVNLCVRAATDAVEDYTGRSFMTRTFLQRHDKWPATCQVDCSVGFIRPPLPPVRYIQVERQPAATIVTLKYYPADLTGQLTIAGANYALDVATGKLTFVDGYVLPSLAVRYDAVEVAFTAGYGTKESAMPPRAIIAIVQLARHCYDNPTAIDATGKVAIMPLAFQHMLRSLRVR